MVENLQVSTKKTSAFMQSQKVWTDSPPTKSSGTTRSDYFLFHKMRSKVTILTVMMTSVLLQTTFWRFEMPTSQ